jgi:hypothetical protein
MTWQCRVRASCTRREKETRLAPFSYFCTRPRYMMGIRQE